MKADQSGLDSVLGIDIGSVSLSLVQMDLSGKIQKHAYLFHKGNIRESLRASRDRFIPGHIRGIACTTSPGITSGPVHIYDPQVAIIAAAKKICPNAGSILSVGAEKFLLINLSSDGKYEYTRTNSSCAAGTGSFLDQQAYRLNLSSIEELSDLAVRNSGKTPDIASRCAVFAKTDLIHAQQKGFPLEAICDSLCKGLAKNIIDSLFSKDSPALPVLFIGGVSKNKAVFSHLERLLDTKFLQHEYSHLFGSIGACSLMLNEENFSPTLKVHSLDEIFSDPAKKEYYHKPLSLSMSEYPDFRNNIAYDFTPIRSGHSADVQVEVYEGFMKNQTCPAYLGIDIGSTSTKSIIINEDKIPLAGFYTYTSGSPLKAVKSLFEALTELQKDMKTNLSLLGVGTTGSGRKFIGKIIRADITFDEITAHARAAYELNPETDTIIEIGGQDAKFTLMQEGIVTFSQMNSVCAAGTGSFIEEQAMKLGCRLSEYSQQAEGVEAPLASDRCTVFMERDINHLLNAGFSVNEILATALHSVRENYLRKVAVEALVGDHVCFQGATAKNKSLVASFEQKLNRKLFVSRYCHLTGAMGVALLLREEKTGKTGFRGLDLYKEEIPIGNETCQLCSNHCQISIAEVMGEKEAYGFLCGRDYDTKKYVHSKYTGFNLLHERSRISEVKQNATSKHNITIGIPASLHLFEELSMWKRFFNELSIKTVTSEKIPDPVRTGKRIAGAEFCAPIDSLYGHVVYLADKSDYIFLPVSIEARDKPANTEANYCYYTQFSASLVHTLKEQGIHEKCLSPVLNYNKGLVYNSRQILNCLSPLLEAGIRYRDVKHAFARALEYSEERKKKLIEIYNTESDQDDRMHVVLLGRPYVVLSKTLNKGIPDIFSGMGIKTFFQDMIPPPDETPEEIEHLSKKIPWYYAARILETAYLTAVTDNLYPVLITAFKCAPDSFIIEYFKKILAIYNKPYLILQIDEHDSNVGYETRIEAAIRSFRNHAFQKNRKPEINVPCILPAVETRINGKTLLLPSWDPVVSPLLVANLKRTGIDARLLHSSDLIIKKSMVHNTGQCLPLNIITQEFIDYIEEHHLQPENTILWMMESRLTCNLRLYPFYMKSLLESYGNGFEKADVYSGKLTHIEISYGACFYAYFVYMLGGLIRKLGCKIRPYEIIKGETDRAVTDSVKILEKAFTGERSMDEAVSEAVSLFQKIRKNEGNRPKVAIFGDFYVRNNEVMNQGLTHSIEDAGGEVISTPYNDYTRVNIENTLRRYRARGEYIEPAFYRILLNAVKLLERKYYKHFEKYLGDPPSINPKRLEKHLSKFHIDLFHSGESYENILKIFYLLENYPDVSLFIQTNPAFCCPSLVTEAMTHEIRRITGVPIVTITYDGTNEYKNDIILPYLQAQ